MPARGWPPSLFPGGPCSLWATLAPRGRLGWALHCPTVMGCSPQPRATKAGSRWTGHPVASLPVGERRLVAQLAALWALARHGTVSSGDRRFWAPAICRLGGMEVSLQAQERKWRLGQAQSRIRAGGTKEGAAGRPRGGLASVLVAFLQEAAGRPGPPGRSACVHMCTHVYLRAGAQATGEGEQAPFPIRNVVGLGVDEPA